MSSSIIILTLGVFLAALEVNYWLWETGAISKGSTILDMTSGVDTWTFGEWHGEGIPSSLWYQSYEIIEAEWCYVKFYVKFNMDDLSLLLNGMSALSWFLLCCFFAFYLYNFAYWWIKPLLKSDGWDKISSTNLYSKSVPLSEEL